VVPFAVVVDYEFAQQVSQVPFAPNDEMVQAFFPNGLELPRLNRSATALQFGLFAGVATLCTPRDASRPFHPAVYSGSRSWITCVAFLRNPSTGSRSPRATCSIHLPSGSTATPAISTARDLSSMTT